MIKSPISFTTSTQKTTLSVRAFFSILGGLAAIIAAVYFLHLEENLNLIGLLWLVLAGFGLYAFMPLAYRLQLLFVLNIAAIFVLLGTWEGMALLVFALALFSILNLPFSVRIRTVILVVAGVLLALGRLKLLPLPFSGVILPLLGGLFMFRSILFLHEQRFAKKETSLWLRLNYFFLLPNLIFVIFPVVDYKTFTNNYYSKPASATYRKGILWMANGVVHLFVYRLIYYYLVPNPTDIQDVFGWLQFIVTSYALIVRLAGIFHLSAGIICLFGFDLPPTFNHYFFADSFSNLWRRVNIYWRDFVMKVIYYPIYFKIKHLGTVKAIAISILITFMFNWLLHAYQWFWIRGSFLLTLQDISFWAVFGITVMLNSIYQALPRQKNQEEKRFHLLGACFLSLRVIGIFMFMAFLWSWWTTPSIASWWGLMQVWKEVKPADSFLLLGGLTGLVVIGIIIQFVSYAFDKHFAKKKLGPASIYTLSIIGIWLLALIGIPSFSTQLGTHFGIDMEPVLHTQLNAADRETQFKGYYETMLAGTNLLATPLDEIQEKKPEDWQQLHKLGVVIFSNDMIGKNLKPNSDLIFKGASFKTNDLGLRDRPVLVKRPVNTLRMALLGGSIEMGSGVTTEQTYENLAEDQLTIEKLFAPYERVEIVNFGVPGTHLPQHIARLDKIVPDFQPQVVIYTAHSDEVRRTMDNLYKVFLRNLTDYDYINTFFAELNLPKTVDEYSFGRSVRPKMMNFIAWGLTHIKQKTEAMGAIPVWMFVPALDGIYTPKEDEQLRKLATELGFFVLDLHSFNGKIPEKEIVLRSWDFHPNALGHELLAKKICQEFRKNTALKKRIIDSYNSQ